jgi:hypothetical protein
MGVPRRELNAAAAGRTGNAVAADSVVGLGPMPITARVLLLTAAWQVPLGWTVLWGIFRGAYAHGGYRWWQHAHYGGLVLLGLGALAVHRRYGGPMLARELTTAAAAFASCLLLATLLSFQCGLAIHELPESLGGFLFHLP